MIFQFCFHLQGNTAVHYAVTHGNFEIVSLLLDTGLCDLDKQNKAGYTAIIMAAVSFLQTDRQHEVIRRLFHMGDINARASKVSSHVLPFQISLRLWSLFTQPMVTVYPAHDHCLPNLWSLFTHPMITVYPTHGHYLPTPW